MFHLYKDLFRNVDAATDGYISGTVADVITFITPIVTSLLIIYIALWGMALMRGAIQEPIKDGLGRIIRIVLVVSIALNLGLYNNVVADFLYNGPDQIANVVSGAAPSSELLDNLAEDGIIAGFRAWNEAGIVDGDFGMYLSAFAIWISTAVVVGYTGFLLILSKLALVVLLAVGPIFIILILFSTTQRFFEMWLGQVINYGFLIIIAVSLVQLLVGIFIRFLDSLNAMPETEIKGMFSLVVLAIVTFLILLQVPSIAMALGGGVALTSMGAIGSVLRRTPSTSWLMNNTRPSTVVGGAQRTFRGIKADVRTLTAPSRAVGSLARRRFGGNSVSGR